MEGRRDFNPQPFGYWTIIGQLDKVSYLIAEVFTNIDSDIGISGAISLSNASESVSQRVRLCFFQSGLCKSCLCGTRSKPQRAIRGKQI